MLFGHTRHFILGSLTRDKETDKVWNIFWVGGKSNGDHQRVCIASGLPCGLETFLARLILGSS